LKPISGFAGLTGAQNPKLVVQVPYGELAPPPICIARIAEDNSFYSCRLAKCDTIMSRQFAVNFSIIQPGSIDIAQFRDESCGEFCSAFPPKQVPASNAHLVFLSV
jgi:hypothetical protein